MNLIRVGERSHQASERAAQALELMVKEILSGLLADPQLIAERLHYIYPTLLPSLADARLIIAESVHFQKEWKKNIRRKETIAGRRNLAGNEEDGVQEHLQRTIRNRPNTGPQGTPRHLSGEPLRDAPQASDTMPRPFRGANQKETKAALQEREEYEAWNRGEPLPKGPVSPGPGKPLVGLEKFTETMAKANAKPLLGEGGGDLF